MGRPVIVPDPGKSLADTHPGLLTDWHPDNLKNPNDLHAGSGLKARWRCATHVTWPDGQTRACGWEWPATVASRATAGTRCPACTGKAASPWNNLAALRPDLTATWTDPTRTPESVTLGSGYIATWTCPDPACGHTYSQQVDKRVRGGSCPACNPVRRSAVTPKNNLTVTHPRVAAQWHPDNPVPATAVLSGDNTSYRWLCQAPRARPSGETLPCGTEWPATVNSRTSLGRGCPGCSGRIATPDRNLTITHPNLIPEWHPSNTQQPHEVTAGSHDTPTWLCATCGHAWPSTVHNRTAGKGCPRCAGQVIDETNSLAALRPDLIAEWHPSNTKTPAQVFAKGEYRATWQCTRTRPDSLVRGHTWPAQVRNRTNGTGCPACAGLAVDDRNNTAVHYPDLADDWHPANTLGPDELTPGAHDPIRWCCSTTIQFHGADRACGWEWTTPLFSRTGMNTGCPACDGKAAADWNNLTETHPELARDWDPTNTRQPNQTTAGCNERVSWVCAAELPDASGTCGHRWKMDIKNRSTGIGCGACSGRIATERNRLSLTHPHLVPDWHPSNDRSPDDVVARSDYVARWTCQRPVPGDPEGRLCGHEWNASVADRSLTGTGCPAHAGQAVAWWNNLAYTHPHLVPEWDPANTLRPHEVVTRSARRVDWTCARTVTAAGTEQTCGYTWPTRVSKRSVEGHGCPACILMLASTEEVHLAHELALHLPVNLGRHRVTGHTRDWNVDIHIPDHRLVIEYDGAYWHRDKTVTDQRKTDDLTAADWTVLRVRERPLDLLSPLDVPSTPRRYKTTADTVLRVLRDQVGINLPNLDAYLTQPTLGNATDALAYIEHLKTRQLARARKRGIEPVTRRGPAAV